MTDINSDNPQGDNNEVLDEVAILPTKENSEAENNSDPDSAEETVTYVNGQILRFVRIRFPGNSKSFPFLVGERDYTYGQQVVAMSDRGIDIGYINSFPYETKFREAMLPLKSINKVADKEDFEKVASMKDRENEAENICKDLIDKYKLEMDLTHVELIQFGKKAVFYFIAPKRVDFRDLVKDLVTQLKLRVELRQISVRDRAAALGGIGPCGRELCCSTFLGNYGRVNIRMAKNQNMALNPTRLNGLCGQLKCCLSYEDNVYTHNRESLPEEGNFVALINGDQGKVLKLHVLIMQFDMLTDQGAIRRYTADQYDKNISLPSGYKFPDRFDHVSNETFTVIGKIEKPTSNEDDHILPFEPVDQEQANTSNDEDNDTQSDPSPTVNVKQEAKITDEKQASNTSGPKNESSSSDSPPAKKKYNNKRRRRKPRKKPAE